MFNFGENMPESTIPPDEDVGRESVAKTGNVVHSLEIEECERVELDAGAIAGYSVRDGKREQLPLGASIHNGVFY